MNNGGKVHFYASVERCQPDDRRVIYHYAMSTIVTGLSDDEIGKLAGHFHGLTCR